MIVYRISREVTVDVMIAAAAAWPRLIRKRVPSSDQDGVRHRYQRFARRYHVQIPIIIGHIRWDPGKYC